MILSFNCSFEIRWLLYWGLYKMADILQMTMSVVFQINQVLYSPIFHRPSHDPLISVQHTSTILPQIPFDPILTRPADQTHMDIIPQPSWFHRQSFCSDLAYQTLMHIIPHPAKVSHFWGPWTLQDLIPIIEALFPNNTGLFSIHCLQCEFSEKLNPPLWKKSPGCSPPTTLKDLFKGCNLI